MVLGWREGFCGRSRQFGGGGGKEFVRGLLNKAGIKSYGKQEAGIRSCLKLDRQLQGEKLAR